MLEYVDIHGSKIEENIIEELKVKNELFLPKSIIISYEILI